MYKKYCDSCMEELSEGESCLTVHSYTSIRKIDKGSEIEKILKNVPTQIHLCTDCASDYFGMLEENMPKAIENHLTTLKLEEEETN